MKGLRERISKELRPIVVFASRKGPQRAVRSRSEHTAFRDVAQVVARVVRDHEAAGSNPVIPILAAYQQS